MNKKLKNVLQSRELLVLFLLFILIISTGLFNSNFLQATSIIEIFNTSLTLMLIAVGEMFVIITRGIDVSVAAITGLSAVVLGTTLNMGWPIALALLATIATGILAGAVNAIGVTFLKVPPIIMTLGTLGIYRGLMRIIAGGSWIERLPQNIKNPNIWRFLDIPFFVWLSIAIVIVTSIISFKYKKARYLYAIGDNANGAFLLGIPVKLSLFSAYTLAGFFSALAAIVYTSQIGFISMNAADGFELKAIAACVLGGVGLMGGVGTAIGAAIGALFLTAVRSMLVFLGIPGILDNAFAGAILLLVVYIDYRVRKSLEYKQIQARAQSEDSTNTGVNQ